MYLLIVTFKRKTTGRFVILFFIFLYTVMAIIEKQRGQVSPRKIVTEYDFLLIRYKKNS